jgi:hypothetical protein
VQLVPFTQAAPLLIRTYRLYFGGMAREKMEHMEVLYAAGIALFWASLLFVVKRRPAGTA